MNFLPYENKEFGFKINYPEDWDVYEQPPLVAAAFLGPLKNDSKYQPRVNIIVIDLSEKQSTLEESINEAPKQLKVYLKDFEQHDQNKIKLGGKEGYQHIYSGTQPFGHLKGLKFKYLQAWTFKEFIQYQFGYSHGPDFFQEYLPTIEEMKKSFVFI